jgi:hypothetical protein
MARPGAAALRDEHVMRSESFVIPAQAGIQWRADIATVPSR